MTVGIMLRVVRWSYHQ